MPNFGEWLFWKWAVRGKVEDTKIRVEDGKKKRVERGGKEEKKGENLTGRAVDGMSVHTRLIGTHDRVHTRESSATTALHAPESRGAAGGVQGHGAELGDLHDCARLSRMLERVSA